MRMFSGRLGVVLAAGAWLFAAGARADSPPVPLPNVAFVMLGPDKAVKPADQHLGALLSVLLEQAALENPGLNVITQGAQGEILDDVGMKLGSTLDVGGAMALGKLAGATHVVFGTFKPGKGGHTYALKVAQPTASGSKDLPPATGSLPDVLKTLSVALATELGVPALTPPPVPASAKAQLGLLRCQAFSLVAVERAAVKGRTVALPGNVKTACEDAAAEPGFVIGTGASLAARALTGDTEARTALAAHVAANPLDRTALLAHARVLNDAGNAAEGRKVLDAVAARRPRDPDIMRMQGELAMEERRYPDAKQLFARAAAEAPASPYLRYRLSYAAYRSDEPAPALDHARQALQLAGGNAPFYQLNLAERLIDAGTWPEAATLLKEVVQKMPGRLTPRVRLGYVHLQMKNADAALNELRDAEKLKPSEREIQRNIPLLLLIDLARAHAMKGNNVNALKMLQQLKKDGGLELLDLNAPEFESVRALPEFKKLVGG